jgi:hypothetical protein
MAKHGAGSRRRSHETEEHRHRCGLAGAVGADEAGDDTGWQLDVEVVDRGSPAEPLGESADGQRSG